VRLDEGPEIWMRDLKGVSLAEMPEFG